MREYCSVVARTDGSFMLAPLPQQISKQMHAAARSCNPRMAFQRRRPRSLRCCVRPLQVEAASYSANSFYTLSVNFCTFLRAAFSPIRISTLENDSHSAKSSCSFESESAFRIYLLASSFVTPLSPIARASKTNSSSSSSPLESLSKALKSSVSFSSTAGESSGSSGSASTLSPAAAIVHCGRQSHTQESCTNWGTGMLRWDCSWEPCAMGSG